MNYSRSTKRKKDFAKRIVISWVIMFILGLLLGIGIGTLIGKATAKETISIDKPDTPTIFFTDKVQETELITTENVVEPEKAEPVCLGVYRITAYCACEKCCGEWAKNRPGGIVKGAAGIELTPGYSAASPLPFGTELYIEGYGDVVIQDRTATWVVEKYEGKVIDIYFDNHDEALEFGCKWLNVYQKESEDINND